ncbi:hypothetical protein AAVH_32935 [Aphelenchoides avenae]|nr:hypothetical protein AAVH_32935 [Aphelenchus avenae]
MDQPSTSQAALADDDVTNRFLQGELSYDEYMRQTGGLDMTAEVAEMGLEHEEEVDDEELEQDLRTIAHVNAINDGISKGVVRDLDVPADLRQQLAIDAESGEFIATKFIGKSTIDDDFPGPSTRTPKAPRRSAAQK